MLDQRGQGDLADETVTLRVWHGGLGIHANLRRGTATMEGGELGDRRGEKKNHDDAVVVPRTPELRGAVRDVGLLGDDGRLVGRRVPQPLPFARQIWGDSTHEGHACDGTRRTRVTMAKCVVGQGWGRRPVSNTDCKGEE
jgi:hypothetical protein